MKSVRKGIVEYPLEEVAMAAEWASNEADNLQLKILLLFLLSSFNEVKIPVHERLGGG